MSSLDYGHPDRMSPQELEIARCQIAVAKAYPDAKGRDYNYLLELLLSNNTSAVNARKELATLMPVHTAGGKSAEIVIINPRKVSVILDSVKLLDEPTQTELF